MTDNGIPYGAFGDNASDDPETESRELAMLYGEIAAGYLMNNDRIPDGPKAKIIAWLESERRRETFKRIKESRIDRYKVASAKRIADAARKRRERLQDWIDGVPGVVVPYGALDSDHSAYVRAVNVERDDRGTIISGTVETSLKATVPVTDAIRAYRFAAKCRQRSVTWRRNGDRIRVGHFQLDSISADGSFCAGCHRLSWRTIHGLAERLGIAVSA